MRKSDFELAEIVCKAWNEKNVDFLEPYLSDEFINESVWVLETMHGNLTSVRFELTLNYIFIITVYDKKQKRSKWQRLSK